jgi:hypothetical protein
VRIQPPALEDKVVALIREEFGAVVRASRKFFVAYTHFFTPTWAAPLRLVFHLIFADSHLVFMVNKNIDIPDINHY